MTRLAAWLLALTAGIYGGMLAAELIREARACAAQWETMR